MWAKVAHTRRRELVVGAARLSYPCRAHVVFCSDVLAKNVHETAHMTSNDVVCKTSQWYEKAKKLIISHYL